MNEKTKQSEYNSQYHKQRRANLTPAGLELEQERLRRNQRNCRANKKRTLAREKSRESSRRHRQNQSPSTTQRERDINRETQRRKRNPKKNPKKSVRFATTNHDNMDRPNLKPPPTPAKTPAKSSLLGRAASGVASVAGYLIGSTGTSTFRCCRVLVCVYNVYVYLFSFTCFTHCFLFFLFSLLAATTPSDQPVASKF